MRRFTAMTAVVLSASLLAGCGLSDDESSDVTAPPTSAVDKMVDAVEKQKRGENDAALAAYDELTKSGSEEIRVKSHFNRGVILGAQGKHEEAAAEYVAALALRPQTTDASYNLGVELRALDKKQEALDRFVITLAMPGAQAYAVRTNLNVAELRDLLGDEKGAREAYKAAVAADPKAPVPEEYR